jgi:putative FmdB family regulatory protein
VPTYDYLCAACGHREEIVHGIHGQGPTACPVCGGAMRKAVAAPAVHFKGSGWAKKDRGAAIATRAAAKAEAGGDGSSEASSKPPDKDAPATSDKATDKSPDKGSSVSKASTSSDPPANKRSSSASAEGD